jgi:hypothetical protein
MGAYFKNKIDSSKEQHWQLAEPDVTAQYLKDFREIAV